MSRIQLLTLVVCLLATTTGCRNFYKSCANGPFAGSPTIDAAPTYSLNIPSVAKNPPYYVPGTNAAAPANALNPGGIAPTPAISPVPNNWAPKPGNAPGAINSGPTGSSAISPPTTFVETSPSYPANYRYASSTTLPGAGLSYKDSTNYLTTQIDETLDGSRLPATDASNVRAPAQNYPIGNVARVAQPRQPTAPSYPATYNSTASVSQPYSVPQNGVPFNNGQPGYLATPVVAGNGAIYSGTVYAGQPGGSQSYIGAPVTSSPPTVLAQASTTYDPASGSQFGWRDRELDAANER